jgi:monovalent cation/proton antiporter MnhG/PhaG subunit
MLTLLAGILILLGAVFTMLAGIGTLRFDDVYSRMHPAAKGPTLGLLLVAIGAAIELRELGPILALALVVVLQFWPPHLEHTSLVGQSISASRCRPTRLMNCRRSRSCSTAC